MAELEAELGIGLCSPGPRALFRLSAARVFLRQISCFSPWLLNERPARAEPMLERKPLCALPWSLMGLLEGGIFPMPHQNSPGSWGYCLEEQIFRKVALHLF